MDDLSTAVDGDAHLKAHLARVQAMLHEPRLLDRRGRDLAEALAMLAAGTILRAHAPAAVADAFIGTRLSGPGRQTYGQGLDWADTLQQRMDERFWDAESGGWFSTTGADPSVLVRLKEDYDGAEPSAGALASLNILMLSNLLPDDGRMARVERALGRFGERLGEVARVVPLVAAAASTWTAGVGQVVVSSTGEGDEAAALHSAIASHYLPFIVAVPVTDTSREELAARLPFIASLPPRDGAATAYVCRNFVCQAPASSVEALEAVLLAR